MSRKPLTLEAFSTETKTRSTDDDLAFEEQDHISVPQQEPQMLPNRSSAVVPDIGISVSQSLMIPPVAFTARHNSSDRYQTPLPPKNLANLATTLSSISYCKKKC